MFELYEVSVAAPDPDWLAALGAYLVETRLAANAYLTPVQAIYRSQGQVRHQAESRLTMHTRRSHVPAIVEHVTSAYPGELPRATAIPITDGDPTHLQWVRDQTNTRAPAAAALGHHQAPRSMGESAKRCQRLAARRGEPGGRTG